MVADTLAAPSVSAGAVAGEEVRIPVHCVLDVVVVVPLELILNSRIDVQFDAVVLPGVHAVALHIVVPNLEQRIEIVLVRQNAHNPDRSAASVELSPDAWVSIGTTCASAQTASTSPSMTGAVIARGIVMGNGSDPLTAHGDIPVTRERLMVRLDGRRTKPIVYEAFLALVDRLYESGRLPLRAGAAYNEETAYHMGSDRR